MLMTKERLTDMLVELGIRYSNFKETNFFDSEADKMLEAMQTASMIGMDAELRHAITNALLIYENQLSDFIKVFDLFASWCRIMQEIRTKYPQHVERKMLDG